MRFPGEGRGGCGCRIPPAKLLRFHRHSLASLLVIGGQVDERQAVALAFHETGPLRQGPFVFLDCARQEPAFRGALEAALTQVSPPSGTSPVLAAWGGTLHLDSVQSLSVETQRLLLCLVHRLQSDQDAWPLRLSVGAPCDLEDAVSGGRFLPALYDGLDKIRFELGRPVAA